MQIGPIVEYSEAETKGSYVLRLLGPDGKELDSYSSFPRTELMFDAILKGYGIEDKVLEEYHPNEVLKLKEIMFLDTILLGRLKKERDNDYQDTGRYEVRLDGFNKFLWYNSLGKLKSILEKAGYTFLSQEELEELRNEHPSFFFDLQSSQ